MFSLSFDEAGDAEDGSDSSNKDIDEPGFDLFQDNPDDYSAFLDDSDLIFPDTNDGDTVPVAVAAAGMLEPHKNILSVRRSKSSKRKRTPQSTTVGRVINSKHSSRKVGGEAESWSLSPGMDGVIIDSLDFGNSGNCASNSPEEDGNNPYDAHDGLFDFDGGGVLDHVDLELGVGGETADNGPPAGTFKEAKCRNRTRPRKSSLIGKTTTGKSRAMASLWGSEVSGYLGDAGVVVGGNGSTAGCDDDDEDGDEEDDDEEEDDGDEDDEDHSKFENMVANGCGEMLMGSLGSGGMDGKKRRKRKKTGDAPPGKTPIQEEVRIEYTRQRNREHARATRRRKKMYVECLKSQVADLLHKQQLMDSGAYTDLLESSGGTAAQIATIRKAVIQTFLQYRTKDMLEQSRWRDLAETTFVLTLPRTPFRGENIGEIMGNNRRFQGIPMLMQDIASITAMLSMISGRVRAQKPKLPTKQTRIGINYTVDSSDVLLVGERLMCHWTMSTSGLVRAGFESECTVDGMLKCSFNTRHKLTEMEITYDVMAFTRQLQKCSLIDLSVIFQQSLRGPMLSGKKIPPAKSTVSNGRDGNGRLPMRAMMPLPPLRMPNMKNGAKSQTNSSAVGAPGIKPGMMGMPMMGMMPPHLMMGMIPGIGAGGGGGKSSGSGGSSNSKASDSSTTRAVAGLHIPNGMKLQLPFTTKRPPSALDASIVTGASSQQNASTFVSAPSSAIPASSSFSSSSSAMTSIESSTSGSATLVPAAPQKLAAPSSGLPPGPAPSTDLMKKNATVSLAVDAGPFSSAPLSTEAVSGVPSANRNAAAKSMNMMSLQNMQLAMQQAQAPGNIPMSGILGNIPMPVGMTSGSVLQNAQRGAGGQIK
jgi:hypothetical protein